MSKISKIRFKGYSEEVRRKLLKQLVKLDGRIGFRGYTKQDIVERSNGVLAYSPTNILNNKIVNGKNDTYISQAKYEESPEIMVKKNNILFVKTGSTLGKSSIVRELTEPATINPQLIVIKTIHVDSDYLAVYLLTDSIQKQIFQAKIGGAVPTLTETEIGKFVISLPSLPEQQAIGSFFRTLDDLLTSYKDNLANYQSLKATMLSKMFPKAGQTVPEIRLDGFEGKWEEKYIGELADIVRGASPRPIQDPKWFNPNSKIGWLRISDVTSQNGRINNLEQKISKLGQEKTRVLTEPHLLLSIAATVGKPVVNYVKTGVHDGFLIFMNPKFDREFMFQWLEMFREKWNRYGQPGSQVNLNSDIVKNQKILIPSMEEQCAIGIYFSNLDILINSYQEKISQLEALKKKLLQDMFI